MWAEAQGRGCAFRARSEEGSGLQSEEREHRGKQRASLETSSGPDPRGTGVLG